MKKIALLFVLIFAFALSPFAQNNYCNFTLNVGEGIDLNQSYEIDGIAFEGLKRMHKKKVSTKMNLTTESVVDIATIYFQNEVGNVCRYKKYDLKEIKLIKEGEKINVLLIYETRLKSTKSKS